MPIYAYECRKCGEREEYIQKMSDPPMKKCEHCGGRLNKLMTAAAFHLKGGGWYADGYASAKGEGGSAGDDSTNLASQSDKGDKGDKGDKSAKSDASETSSKKKPADSKKAADNKTKTKTSKPKKK